MQDKQAVEEAARIIGISIRTAPKSAGIDDVSYLIVNDEQRKRISSETKKIAGILGKNEPEKVRRAISLDWHSDADAIGLSDSLILIGVKGRRPLGFNCGGCGFKSCEEFIKAKPPKTIFIPGPFCIFKLFDLGIALASAAKTASTLNIDSRIMYRAGLSAYRLDLLEGYSPILSLGLSATGKNIFFDRKEKLEAKELWKQIKGGSDG